MIGDLLWRCESTSASGILLPEEGTAVALFEGGYWVRGSVALERAATSALWEKILLP